MSLISHSFMPRSMFDLDLWLNPLEMGPSTLDIFDPFDELDRMIGRNFNWLSKPEFLAPTFPQFPNKLRVKLDCSGYSSNSIKTEIKNDQLIVTGSEGFKKYETDDFSLREFRKTFKLTPNTENDKLVSFLTSNGTLVIEIPINEKTNSIGDLFPKISEDKTNVSMNLSLPDNLDPTKLSVTCKDRQLIVKYQNKSENEESFSDVYFYKQILMPENTDFETITCTYDKNNLSVTAPLRKISIITKKNQLKYKK